MLEKNPYRQCLDDAIAAILYHAGTPQDIQELDRLNDQRWETPPFVYSDTGGAHRQAAMELLQQADKQGVIAIPSTSRRAAMHAIQMNPAHALPVAYMLAAELYEQTHPAVGGSQIPSLRKSSLQATEKLLQTALRCGKIRGTNDLIAALDQPDQPDLDYEVTERMHRLKETHAEALEDSDGECFALQLESLGQLCAEEIQHRTSPAAIDQFDRFKKSTSHLESIMHSIAKPLTR